MKKGFLTSEFWLTIVATIGGLGVATGKITPEASNAAVQAVGAIASAIASVGYAYSRAKVKAAPPKTDS